MGGLARRASYIKQKLEQLPKDLPHFVLNLDAGGFAAGLGEAKRIKTAYLLKGFRKLNYLAVNVGYRDLVYGTPFIEQMHEQQEIPFLSANIVVDQTEKLFLPPYIIKTFQGAGVTIKVGIFGLTTQNKQLIPEQRLFGGKRLHATDPVEAAQAVLAKLRKETDLVICLADMRLSQARPLAEKVKGIDIVLLGNDYRILEATTSDEKTLLVSVGRQGKYMGDLQITLDDQKRIIERKHQAPELNESYPDVAEFVQLVEEYNLALKKYTESQKTNQN